MTTESLWQWDTCERISTILSSQPAIRALWLGGSLARGDADRFSDIDLVVLATSVDEAALIIETGLASEFALVLVRNRGDENYCLLNFVTAEWKRFDVSVFSANAISRSKLRGLRTLFDKDGLDLPVGHGEPPIHQVVADEVYFVVTEFMRVLGLLPVVLHRKDFVAAVSGSGLLREHLVTLLKYERTGRIRTGALSQTRSLTSAAASAILELPPLRADRASILDFNRSCWEVFIHYGLSICRQYDVEWPSELAAAVRSSLARDLGLELH